MAKQKITRSGRAKLSADVDKVCERFNIEFPDVVFTDQTRSHIALNILSIGLKDVMESLEIAISKEFLLEPSQVIAYFFGVCKNKKAIPV